ncbi:MAG: protein kinase [Bacteroidota bacterium]|jgi:serine/threonine protein kinase
MVGQTISHYQILEKLGGGGMGVVYKAHDLKLDRAVALKFLPPQMTLDPKAKERFALEAKAASSIDHPNICTVYDVEEASDGRMFIVMPHYEGETLKKKIERGPLQLAEAIDIAIQIARGLSEAHRHGIVHRDIKPANILVTNSRVVKILDFGLAKLEGSLDITKSGSRLGTTAYMAPEQVRAEQVDHRADIWSLGVVLYEMLTGKTPFTGDNEAAIMYSIVSDKPPSMQAMVPKLSRGIELVVNHAISKAKGDRYQTMDEFASDLEAIRSASSVSGPTVAEAAAKRRATSRFLKTVLAVGSLALILAVGYYVLQPILSDEALVPHPESVLTVSFENQSGDTTLDYLQRAIPALLVTRLEESPYLQVVTQERMSDIIRNMGKGAPRFVDEELGAAICLKEGIRKLITGSFNREGDLFTSRMKVLDPSSKQVLRISEAKGKGIESLLASQIDELSKAAQSGIGLSQSRIQESDRPVAQLTTESPQALDWYLKGKEAQSDYRWPLAAQCYRAAVALDSSFAAAYWNIFACEDNADNPSVAYEALRKANEWQWRASDKVRLLIEADYAGFSERNREKRLSILRHIIKRFPLEKEAYESLFYVYSANRDPVQAKSMLEKIVELDPTNEMALNELAGKTNDTTVAFSYLRRIVEAHPKNTNGLDTWAMMYLEKGLYDNAIAKLNELESRDTSDRGDWSIAYVTACKEDIDGAVAVLQSGNRLTRGLLEYLRGREKDAIYNLRLTRMANESKREEDVAQLVTGWIHLEKNRYQEARRCFELYADSTDKHNSVGLTKYARDRNPFYHFSLGYLELVSGNLALAQKHLAALKMDSIDRHRQAAVRAGQKYLKSEILLAEGNVGEALASTKDLEPGAAANVSFEWDMISYNIPLSFRDLRARIWAKAGGLDSAIATYEQFMSPSSGGGRVHLISPVFHLRLGALYERIGQFDKARNQYQILLRIWQHAEAGLPELAETQSRLTKLNK